MSKILLTGSEGYIGKNLQSLYGYFLPVDLENGKNVIDLTADDLKDITGIVHLAAISGIKECDTNKELAVEYNTWSTYHLLSLRPDVPFIFASSQAAKNPVNWYAKTKLQSERYIMEMANKFVILRFSNVYGGFGYLTKKTSVVANFLNAAISNQPLIINGDGSQTRDFIHVDDVCKCIVNAIKNPCNRVIDIGSGIGTSIKDLAMSISDNIQYKEGSHGVDGNVASIDDMENLLNVVPKKTLSTYIKDQLTVTM
jgi:UDP-glucose 4-epimerase